MSYRTAIALFGRAEMRTAGSTELVVRLCLFDSFLQEVTITRPFASGALMRMHD